MKSSDYRKKAIEHLVEYKENVLNLKNKNGMWHGKPYDHILPNDSESKNFIDPGYYDFSKLYKHKLIIKSNQAGSIEVGLHINYAHLNSSQVMCINYFTPLLFYQVLLKEIIRVFTGVKLSGNITGNFEYTPHEIDNRTGCVLYFRESKDYYNEINKLSNGTAPVTFNDIIGKSIIINNIKKQAMLISKSTSTVLIQGESGTGKEIFSRAIHAASNRASAPFITINCAAIPDNLLESELFGYEEGAFTGAVKGGKVGKFQLANTGTLFLDEVGEIPIHLQAKLLRALQEKKIQRVGGNRDIDIDIRVIAATNRDLEEMTELGEFRKDLYYRLNVIPITIPPLRERKSDIPQLLEHYVNQYNYILDKKISGFSREAINCINEYNWPGNIRELQNMVEYCVNIADSNEIQQNELPRKLKADSNSMLMGDIRTLDEVEKDYIHDVVRYFGNNASGKEKASKALGIGIATLYRKLK